jgi:hypothetical protein
MKEILAAAMGQYITAKKYERGLEQQRGRTLTLAMMKEWSHKVKEVSGDVPCSLQAMGGDPLTGFLKWCYCQPNVKQTPVMLHDIETKAEAEEQLKLQEQQEHEKPRSASDAVLEDELLYAGDEVWHRRPDGVLYQRASRAVLPSVGRRGGPEVPWGHGAPGRQVVIRKL